MDFDSIIVLIGGGHVSGKRTAAELLRQELETALPKQHLDIHLLDMEKYLKPESKNHQNQYSSSKSAAITVSRAEENQFPPLKPSRYDFSLLKSDLHLFPSKGSILLVHGLYALYDAELRKMSKMKVFISSDADTRLIRWIRRDVLSGSDGLEMVINRYLQGARAEMSDFINPTKEYSDVIMPSGPEANSISILVDGIVSHISNLQPHTSHLRSVGLHYPEEKRSFYELT